VSPSPCHRRRRRRRRGNTFRNYSKLPEISSTVQETARM
jgi:hypothetical protein